jgi:hypothetical protein
MGLYLAIFDDGDELDGVEVGSYSDFDTFREAIVANLENGVAAGSRFPTLILHADCDGQWTPTEAAELERELEIIRVRFQELPPIALDVGWKEQVAKTFALQIDNLHDCFFDVDGEPLLERLINLARLSQAKDLPILFQ